MKIPRSYKHIKKRSLNKIRVPDTERLQFDNGLVVHLMEDHGLPSVSMSVLVRAGSRYNPRLKAGLPALVARLLWMGGTIRRTAEVVGQEIDRMGALLDVGSGENCIQVSTWTLKEDFVYVLELAADIIRNPAFPEDKFEWARTVEKNLLARTSDGSFVDAFHEFTTLMSGKNTAYGRRPDVRTFESITRDDVVAYHNRCFRPGNILVGAWGDFEAQQASVLMEDAFGRWPQGGDAGDFNEATTPISTDPRAHAYFSERRSTTRPWVLSGGLGCERRAIEHSSLTLATRILDSRLRSIVRSDRGLAYLVGARLDAGWDHPGTWVAFANTDCDSLPEVVGIIRDEIHKMQDGEVSVAELERARAGVQKGYGFDFATPAQVVNTILWRERHGYEPDDDGTFYVSIGNISRSDVLRASREFLCDDKLVTLVLGSPTDLLPKLKGLELTRANRI
jgi:zinc protease